jgi:multidrug transporter EmrE-like cation transporter
VSVGPSPLAVAVASILLSVFAQIAMKIGSASAASAAATTSPDLWRQTVSLLFHPMVMVGLALYAASAILWLHVLARWDVSKAYPMVGLGFVLTLAVGALFLGEQVTWQRTAGCLLICAGLVMIVRT